MDHFYSEIFRIFPNNIKDRLMRYVTIHKIQPEEIRIKLGQPITLRLLGQEYICSDTIVSEQEIAFIMMNASNGSFHAAADHIQNGYFPLPNGCRLGFCGTGRIDEQKICNISHISSLCIRIAKQELGCSDEIIESCYVSGFKNTIIVGKPGAGKTTLLRDCIRNLSDSGKYIAVADERGEIAGMKDGTPFFNLGERTDIMHGIKKQQAAMMLLRTMSPDILAMDEITASMDMPAIIEAVGCGVGLLTTIHGETISDLEKPAFRGILESKYFEIAVFVDSDNHKRTYRMERLNV